jgi:hypothetical protein
MSHAPHLSYHVTQHVLHKAMRLSTPSHPQPRQLRPVAQLQRRQSLHVSRPLSLGPDPGSRRRGAGRLRGQRGCQGGGQRDAGRWVEREFGQPAGRAQQGLERRGRGACGSGGQMSVGHATHGQQTPCCNAQAPRRGGLPPPSSPATSTAASMAAPADSNAREASPRDPPAALAGVPDSSAPAGIRSGGRACAPAASAEALGAACTAAASTAEGGRAGALRSAASSSSSTSMTRRAFGGPPRSSEEGAAPGASAPPGGCHASVPGGAGRPATRVVKRSVYLRSGGGREGGVGPLAVAWRRWWEAVGPGGAREEAKESRAGACGSHQVLASRSRESAASAAASASALAAAAAAAAAARASASRAAASASLRLWHPIASATSQRPAPRIQSTPQQPSQPHAPLAPGARARPPPPTCAPPLPPAAAHPPPRAAAAPPPRAPRSRR